MLNKSIQQEKVNEIEIVLKIVLIWSFSNNTLTNILVSGLKTRNEMVCYVFSALRSRNLQNYDWSIYVGLSIVQNLITEDRWYRSCRFRSKFFDCFNVFGLHGELLDK